MNSYSEFPFINVQDTHTFLFGRNSGSHKYKMSEQNENEGS